MDKRKEQFKTFAGFDFSDLDVIVWKIGCQPQNAIDYYYHIPTKTIYSYYFGDKSGCWRDDLAIDTNDVASPRIINPSLVDFATETTKHGDGCTCTIS